MGEIIYKHIFEVNWSNIYESVLGFPDDVSGKSSLPMQET